MTSAIERTRKLGFKNHQQRHRFLQEHAAEIVADLNQLGSARTKEKWHIGSSTIAWLLGRPVKPRGKPAGETIKTAQPVSAKEFAHAILEDYSTLKTENYQLKQQVKALKLQIHGYELVEQRQKVEDEQVFQAKVKRALAEPGENKL